MKKILFSLLVGACGAVTSHAVPAYPYPVEITQPDGSKVTLQLHGDEYSNITTTADGYTVVHSAVTGAWEYARIEADTLASIGVVARDAVMRTTAETAALASIPRYLSPTPSSASREMRSRARKLSSVAYPRVLGGSGHYDYSKFRGLVILVEFSDAPFSRTDINQIFTDMITRRNYTGFMTAGGILAEKVEYTGSVRDYYYDNSCGQFDPQFDVVGPVKIDYPSTFPAQTARAQQVVAAAINAADDIVDYSKYDTDGDGTVDMVYFIFSGAGSNVAGNNSMLIWPHASVVFPTISRDGVKFGRYACSTELLGTPAAKVLDGIGTIVHEFSHVLGLPDLYDTDYENGGGGQCVHPGTWSVMASGSYLNNSRTPCGYTLYERYAVGFTTPETISEAGDYTLEDVAVSNTGYRIDSPVENEFFLLDNRRLEGWNKYLPGEGMMVWRVDSTNVAVWEDNDVNANPSHPYFEILRANPADPIMSGNAPRNTAGDTFPGSGNVTELNSTSTPALISWNGSPSSLGLYDIAETASGSVTFTVRKAEVTTLVEDFETMPLTTADASGVAGRFSPWTFSAAVVAEPLAAMGDAYGSRAAGINRGGFICSDQPVEQTVTSISFDFYNPSSSTVTLRCGYTFDGEFIKYLTPTGESSSMVTIMDRGGRLTFPVPDVAGAMYYIEIRTGSTGYHYVDNLTLLCKGGSTTGIDAVPTGTEDLAAVVTGDCVELSGCEAAEARLFDLAGRHVAVAAVDADGMARFAGLRAGVYVVACGSGVAKVMVR